MNHLRDAPGIYSNEGHSNSPDGPVGDMARAALEGHPSVMGRFQYREEDIREQMNAEAAQRPPLRGQTELLAMIDDISFLPGNLSTITSLRDDKNKASKCIQIAKSLFGYCEDDPVEIRVEETAIDLMPLPIMNIERIHKRLGLDKKPAIPQKLLNRFEILKKE